MTTNTTHIELNEKNKEAMKYLSALQNNIAFGDVVVQNIAYIGNGIVVEGEYTPEAIKRKDENLAEELLDLFISKSPEDKEDEPVLHALATGMIEIATFAGMSKEAIDLFAEKLRNACDLSV